MVANSIPDKTQQAWDIALDNLLKIRDHAAYHKNENDQRNEEKAPKWLEILLCDDSEAGKLWGKWYNANTAEIVKARAAGDSQKVSALTKLSIITSRLILLNEMMIVAQGGGYRPEQISTQAVKSALKQSDYFKITSFYAFSIIDEQKSEGQQMHRDTKCDWLEIFTTQEEVTNGLTSSEIANRILTKHGKTSKTARAWIKNDLAIAPNLPTDDKRTKRYTI